MYYSRINLEAEKAAKKIIFFIEKLGSDASTSALIKWIENNFNCAVKIDYVSFGLKKCSGLVYPKYGGKMYQIWINSDDVPTRQNFTRVHELAHIIWGISGYGFSQEEIGTVDGMERFCDRFSAAYLMPEEKFKRVWSIWHENFNIKKYRVAQVFQVSVEAVHYRAKELDLF